MLSTLALVFSALPAFVAALFLLVAEANAATYALLVGVGDYPQLPAKLRLQGPRNDVEAMRGMLSEKGIPTNRIRTLVDREATLANIKSAIQKLTREVRREDLVVLYFSGHGSQAPVDVIGGRRNEENDQLDELFLAADVGAWDGRRGRVRNALRDDDLNELISLLRRQGAFVWAIFDTCHAETSTRDIKASDPGNEDLDSKARSVPPDVLGVPKNLLRNSVRSAASRDVMLKRTDLGPGAAGLVAYYAADADGKARERVFTDGLWKRRHHGVFTHALVSALRSNQALPSYQSLLEQVSTLTHGEPGQPSPLMEGVAYLSAPILTPQAFPSPPQTITPELRLAADAKAGQSARQFLDDMLRQNDVKVDGYSLKAVSADKADAWIRVCPNGGYYLSATLDNICTDPGTRALALIGRTSKPGILDETLCRMAAGAHLRRLAAGSAGNDTAAPGVSYEFQRHHIQGWSPLSATPTVQLRSGDVIRPRILMPSADSLEYSHFFIDSLGRAWPFADSRASPAIQAGTIRRELILEGLRIDRESYATLGIERAALVLSRGEKSKSGSNAGWIAMPACGNQGSPMFYPATVDAVVMAEWETRR